MELAPSCSHSLGNRQAGMTLIELLVVLGIIAMLFGLSAGVYQKVARQNALPAASSQVSSVIRAARNFSLSSGLPSRVLVEVGKGDLPGRISAFGFELVAAWQFEDVGWNSESSEPLERGQELRGAFNERAVISGECYPARGKIGAAVSFENDGAAITAPHRPRYYSARGFNLEAWVYSQLPELTERQRKRASNSKGAFVDPRREVLYAIISKSGSYEMGLLGDGAVYVMIGDGGDGEHDYFARTQGGIVLVERWSHINVTFDGLALTVEVDGSEREAIPDGGELVDPRDWQPLPLMVPPSDSNLTISRPNAMFMGRIDQPKIRIALEPRVYRLPAGIYFPQKSFPRKRGWNSVMSTDPPARDPIVIHFDTRGSLDPLYHAAPVTILLASGEEQAAEKPEKTGTTGVRSLTLLEQDPEEERDVELELQDPLAALAKYLAENVDEGVTDEESNKVEDGETNEDKEAASARVRTVIVDLSGTVRG